MKLALPLHHYDLAGRVKPPWLMYGVLFFLARSLIVFVASLSFRQDSTLLLQIFYPRQADFYLSLWLAIPAVLIIFVVGFRDKFWQWQQGHILASLRLVCFLLLGMDFSLLLWQIKTQSFAFSLPIACLVLCSLVCILYWLQSRHLKVMFTDWRLNQ